MERAGPDNNSPITLQASQGRNGSGNYAIIHPRNETLLASAPIHRFKTPVAGRLLQLMTSTRQRLLPLLDLLRHLLPPLVDVRVRVVAVQDCLRRISFGLS